MKKNLNVVITIFAFLIMILNVSCFNAERDNSFDPKSKNYEGKASCEGICPHLWEILTDQDVCWIQGDGDPCSREYGRFFSGCVNLCKNGDDIEDPWSDAAIYCMYDAHDSASFNQCVHNNPDNGNGNIFVNPVNHTFFGTAANPMQNFWIQNDTSYGITINSIESNNNNVFSVHNIPSSIGNNSGEGFDVRFNNGSLGSGNYSAEITIHFYNSGTQQNETILVNVSGSV